MLNKLGKVMLHVVMLAIVCAIGAYWVVRIVTPQPSAAPPPLAAAPPREPNPVLAARMFGLVQAPQAQAVSNIQVSGVFAAGKDSSAVLAIDGKPPRAYVVGQELAPGTRLVEVQPEVVVLESGGVRQEIRMPPRSAVASLGGGVPPAPAYTLQGNVLSAPSSSGGGGGPAMGPTVAPSRPFIPVTPAGQAPQMPPQPPGSPPVGIPLPQDGSTPGPPPMQDGSQPRQQ